MATANDTKAAPAPQLHPCGCGCGTHVKGKYAQGHDARHVSNLRKAYEAGELTRAKAIAQVKDSPKLVAKLTRSIELVDEKRKAAKAAVKDAAKPAAAPRARESKKADPEPPADDSPEPDSAPPADEAA